MGSNQRIRGHRLVSRFCYGVCFGFGFVVTTVTLTAMFWIVWCYFGLTSVPISETQRRALVDYSFTPAPSPTFPPELPETSINQISKLSATSAKPDKKKEVHSDRILTTITRSDISERDHFNKTEGKVTLSESTNEEVNRSKQFSLNTENYRTADPQGFKPNSRPSLNKKDARGEIGLSNPPIKDLSDKYDTVDIISSKVDSPKSNRSQSNSTVESKGDVAYHGSNSPIKSEISDDDDKYRPDDRYGDRTPPKEIVRDDMHDGIDDIPMRERTKEPAYDNTRLPNRRQYIEAPDDQKVVRKFDKGEEFDDGKAFQERTRDDRKIPELVPRREERFESRRPEYDRESDPYYSDDRRRTSERPVDYDRRLKGDRMSQDDYPRRFSDKRRGESDVRMYDDKELDEDRYRNRRVNEEERYRTRRINNKGNRRQIYSKDQYEEDTPVNRGRTPEEDRYLGRDFTRSEMDRSRNSDRYQPRNRDYYNEEGKFYERRDEIPIRERPYPTRYDDKFIDDIREETPTRDRIQSSRSSYRPTSDMNPSRRDGYNTRYESRDIPDRSTNRDFSQIDQEGRMIETRRPLPAEDRYRVDYRYEKGDRATRYNNRDRISPTRVSDYPLNSRMQSDEAYDTRKRYPENIPRESIPIERRTKYDDEYEIKSSRIDNSRNTGGSERRYYNQRPRQDDRRPEYDDGKEVTLDHRSYSPEDEENAKNRRGRPINERDRDYDDGSSRRRYGTDEIKKEYYDESQDYRPGSRSNYETFDRKYRDSIESDSYDRNPNKDRRYEDYSPKSYDRYDRNRDDDEKYYRDRDGNVRNENSGRYDDGNYDRNYDSYSPTNENDRRTSSTDRNDRESSINRRPSLDNQDDKLFQVDRNSPNIRSNKDTLPNVGIQTAVPRRMLNNNPLTVTESSVQKDTNPSDFDADHPMSAKDVIEVALRHSDSKDSNPREIFYPVFDPRGSNLTSSDIVRPSERRGTTINLRRKKK